LCVIYTLQHRATGITLHDTLKYIVLVFKYYDFQFLVIDGIPASEWKEYKVSQNYYWAMGDNRDNSLDSRYWGYIPENYILGEALFTYFSLDLDSWTPRWDRIGTVLR